VPFPIAGWPEVESSIRDTAEILAAEPAVSLSAWGTAEKCSLPARARRQTQNRKRVFRFVFGGDHPVSLRENGGSRPAMRSDFGNRNLSGSSGAVGTMAATISGFTNLMNKVAPRGGRSTHPAALVTRIICAMVRSQEFSLVPAAQRHLGVVRRHGADRG
jgi:hypothetical protein